MTLSPNEEPRRISCPFTLLTFLLAIIVYLEPLGQDTFAQWLCYRRESVLGGEIWRLLTSSLVHSSQRHLLFDTLVFLVLGLLYERSWQGTYGWLLCGSALVTCVSVLLFSPQITEGGGLSGVIHGQWLAALVVEGRRALRQRLRWLWIAPVGAMILLRPFYEIVTGTYLERFLLSPDLHPSGGRPSATAHLGGIVGATFVLITTALFRQKKKPKREASTK